jgi:hypothetical protein
MASARLSRGARVRTPPIRGWLALHVVGARSEGEALDADGWSERTGSPHSTASIPRGLLPGGPAVAWQGGARRAPAPARLLDLRGIRRVILATAQSAVSAYGPAIALIGVGATLWINGRRAERQRRRENHSRAIAAVVAYYEMPFRIRRRRCEPESESAERARLSDEFSAIQVELACCEGLIRCDPDAQVRTRFENLVATLRSYAGDQARAAWEAAAIHSDDQMNMPVLHEALAPIRERQAACETAMASATRGRHIGAYRNSQT